MKDRRFKYIFGPVLSRRLGSSLGVDIVPYKICNFDCVYCECGRTTEIINEQKKFFSIEDIINEIRDFLSNNIKPDFITISGSGEPTLNSDIGLLIKTIKKEFPQNKLALITNSSTFFIPRLRNEILDVDVILPSLDAASQDTFIKINRPHKSINIDEIINGLIELRTAFKNQIWLEILIVKGYNDNPEEIQKLKEAVLKIKPDKIQLNTLDRPAPDNSIKPLSYKEMEGIKNLLSLPDVEIVSRQVSSIELKHNEKDLEKYIIESLSRRPLTFEDLRSVEPNHLAGLCKVLEKLEKSKTIYQQKKGESVFYCINRDLIKK